MAKEARRGRLVPVFLISAWLALLVVVWAWPFFREGKLPIAGDILVGHYHPWVDVDFTGGSTRYPVKNWLLFDGIRQTLPWRLGAIAQMKAGRWPLWNPYNLLGMPLLANSQTAAFYPLNLLFWVMPELPAWSWYVMLAPWLLGLGMWWFLREERLSWWAAAIGGVGVAWSGIMANHLTFGVDGHAFLWLPWAMAATDGLFERKGWWGVGMSGFVALMFLGGYLPPAVYGLGVVVLWVGYKAVVKKAWRRGLEGLVWVGLGLGLSAVQLLPTVELAGQTVRAEKWFGMASGETYFWPWEHLVMVAAPDFYGHPATGNFKGVVNYTDSPYVGAVGLVLVIGSWWWSRQKNKWFVWGVTVASLIYVLPTPVSLAIRQMGIPFVSDVAAMRGLWVTAFGLAWLSALGAEEVMRGRVSWRGWLAVAAIVGGIYGAVWQVAGGVPGGELSVAQRNLVLPTAMAVAGIGLVGARKMGLSAGIIGGLFLMLISGELVRGGAKYNPFMPESLVVPETKILEFLEKEGPLYRTLITHQELFPANANLFYGIPMVDGYYLLRPQRTEQFIALAFAGPDISGLGSFPRVIYVGDPGKAVVDLMGVKYVMSLGPVDNPTWLSKLKLVMQEGETYLYENRQVGPKAWLASSWVKRVGDVEIAKAVVEAVEGQVVVEEELGLPERLTGGEAEVVSYQPGEVVVRVKSGREGLLVVNESFDRGWGVEVDGEKAQARRVDFNLLGMALPEGEHEVRWRYFPESFRWGLVISGISGLGILGMGVVAGKEKKK